MTYPDYVNASDAVGRMIVENTSSTKWTAYVKSNMENPPTNINIIGRTWWTVRELCEATWTRNYQYGGQYWSNSWYAKDKLVYKQPCVGMRFGRSMGAHDFHDTGRPRWQPTNDTQHVQVP